MTQLNNIIQKYQSVIPEKDIRLIIQTILNIPNEDWFFSKDRILSDTEINILDSVMLRRKEGEPVARIFREWEFWGLSFHLSEGTLVPRPDTETLVEAVLKRCPSPASILDLGTGSGCILISLLSEYEDAFGLGVDISQDALKTAKRNAVRHNVFKRCEFLQANWAEPIQGEFDVIVSNPPYIESAVIESLAPEVRNHDPLLALDGGESGLDSIKILLEMIKNCASAKTTVFFEIGYNQADNVMNLIEKYGFSTRDVHKDLAGHKRVIEFGYGDKTKKNESQA